MYSQSTTVGRVWDESGFLAKFHRSNSRIEEKEGQAIRIEKLVSESEEVCQAVSKAAEERIYSSRSGISEYKQVKIFVLQLHSIVGVDDWKETERETGQRDAAGSQRKVVYVVVKCEARKIRRPAD